MKPIPELNFGFNDAENYRKSANRELLNRLFIRNAALDRLVTQETYFLIGEKGTGKTAYSVFLSNNNYKNTRARISYIRETDYQSFVAIKREKQLELSDFSSIWRVILLLLLAQSLKDSDLVHVGLVPRVLKLKALQSAINDYFKNAFAPEIINALNFVRESSIAAKLISKYFNADAGEKDTTSFTESHFQTNLLYIEKKFKEAISSLKLKHNLILFVDGIDIRPESVPYEEYLACIKGLANAIWSLNNDFFPSIRDPKGHLKVVLLVRPDIFAALGLQNQNTKIRDNSVLLDWRTNYKRYRTSELFLLADKLLGHEQGEMRDLGGYWDYYFPYKLVTQYSGEEQETDSSFISFLRFSFWRPRDIVTMLQILKQNFIEERRPNADTFTKNDFDSSIFRRQYADYLLGEIKDHLSFYYTDKEYESFLKFFEFLRGKSKFSYEEYCHAFAEFATFAERNRFPKPDFLTSADSLLQFLYELNILSYKEVQGNEIIRRWCFRERTYANIFPKVKTHEDYEIHYGLSKALNLGNKITIRRNRR